MLPENVPQSEVFSRVLSPYLELFFDGYDLFVIMYGGSGSGKTHTLFGPENLQSEGDHGLMIRFVRSIFESYDYNEDEMTVKVSSFEVTNDDVRDLLGLGIVHILFFSISNVIPARKQLCALAHLGCTHCAGIPSIT